ncbi:MAG: putative hydro-lyase [Clostridia bacterium]
MEQNNLKYANILPSEARELIRIGKITHQTSGMCLGYAQANLVILPKALADDFLLFTQRNPKSCPVLEVSETGARGLKHIAKDADIARDLPKYRVYEKGVLTGEYTDVSHLWRDDFVSFFIGCSFSFESALLDAGVPVRHIEEGKNVPMYITNIDCESAGVFSGRMVVSMRPIPPQHIDKAVEVTAAMPRVHGSPVHIGEPKDIGISNLSRPDFGDSVTINQGEIPVFWCCGVTPQSVVMNVKPEIAITHSPGHMFITDIKNSELMG